jgi:hypothetical protein
LQAQALFDQVPVDIASSTLKDTFGAYATRVYKIH